MYSRLISAIIVALTFTFWSMCTATPAAAEPTQVKEIRGKNLVVYKEATGAPLRKIPAADVPTPLDIMDTSPKGRYQVKIDGEALWIPKAQAITDEIVAGPAVSCQSITTSYASSRAFSDCKE